MGAAHLINERDAVGAAHFMEHKEMLGHNYKEHTETHKEHTGELTYKSTSRRDTRQGRTGAARSKEQQRSRTGFTDL